MAKNKDELSELLAEAENDYGTIADDGIAAGDIRSWISTGSYSLNALLSGSIYGGMPGNKVTAYAGETSTGKTFYAIQAVKNFLEDNEDGMVFIFESESAISKSMLEDRGVNVKRTVVLPVATIQEFRTQSIKILDKYLETKEADRKPMLFVLDSLGNLSTQKEVEDIAAGKDTRDMTRAQLIRGGFRVLTLKLGKAGVGLVVNNHVYDVIGSYFPVKKMGGGAGLEYAASSIVYLTKKKDKDGSGASAEVTGAIITAILKKSRLTIENKKVLTLLNYETGLDKYYGLVDLAIKFGIWKKVSTRVEYIPGKTQFESTIAKNPEKYFTKEVLDQIDESCKQEFLYGKTNVADAEEKE
jgi:RecA/RadA recombinase